MTFFLSEQPRERPANPAPAPNAGALEVAGAAWDAQFQEQGSWLRVDRKRREIEDEIRARIGVTEAEPDAPGFADPRSPEFGVRDIGLRKLLGEVSRVAARDPARVGSLPLDEAQFEAELNRRLQEDYQEDADVLRMGGTGAGLAEFGGRAMGAITDPIGLAMLPLGGPLGTGARGVAGFVGREALLGAAGEAFVLPGMFEMSERLDIPEPDALNQIALGAAGGAALAGVMAGGVRGYQYLRGRQAGEAANAPDMGDPNEVDAAVNAAEAALLRDQPVPGPEATGDADVAGLAGRIIGIESGGNPNARNATPGQSASGLGGFIDSTWLATIRRHRPDLAATMSEAQLLALKSDPALGRKMTVAHTADNVAALRAQGLPSDAGSVYLMHFLGAGGAPRALRADPNAPISAVMSPAQIAANRNIRYGGKFLPDFTVGELRRWAEVKMGQASDPGGGYRASTRAGYTTPDQVVTPGGERIDVSYEIVDADSLFAASGPLQPRDRSRASSDEQIAGMAARLDPARLLPAIETDRGAPIVGPDNIIESGNGRVRAIVMAAEQFPDRYEAYRAAIASVADIPEGVARPILIARRTTELDQAGREAFVRDSNTSAIARMSGTEQAAADAASLDPDTLSLFAPGAPITAPENRPFVRAALARMPQAERAGLVDAGGALNAEGVRRLRQSMFARAYAAPDMTRIMAEAEGGDLRGAIEALGDAAPAWAALRQDIADGLISPELDATPHLMDALRLIAGAREASRASRGKLSVRGAIDDALAQGDMMTGGASPEARGFVEVFYRGASPRAAGDVTQLLTRYVDEARRVGSVEASLFADLETPDATDILNAIRRDDPDFQAIAGRARPGPDADQGGAGPGGPETGDNRADPAGEGVAAATGSSTSSSALNDLPDDADAAFAGLRDAQPFDDVETLYRLAPDAQGELARIGGDLAARFDAKWKNPGIKKRATAEEKIGRKSYSDPRRLTDIVRGGFVVRTAEDADSIVADLAQRFMLIDEGWVRQSTGFVDRKLSVRMSNGLLAEIQIWSTEMYRAKSELGGQKLYARMRSSKDLTERQELTRQSVELYSAATAAEDASFGKALGTSNSPKVLLKRALNASSVSITPPVKYTSAPSTGTQGPPGSRMASASSSENETAGRQSQFMKVIETSSLDTQEVAPSGSQIKMAPKMLDIRTADDGAFAQGAASPGIEAANRTALDDLRAELEAGGDFELATGEAGQTISARALLDDLAEDQEIAEIIGLCQLGGGRIDAKPV